MRLILIGPPGSGKGTQAKLLSQRKELAHIATGDILREAISKNTPLGQQAKPFMDAGKLAPDELVNALIAERFGREDRPDRFVMDGYPRTSAQAETFERVLQEQSLPLLAVVLLDVDDEEIVERITGRRSCPNESCKATYHIKNKPPQVAGICDECGTTLIQRADDHLETIRARLQVYHGETAELIPHYRQLGLLRHVPGGGGIEQAYQCILEALQQ